MYANLQNTHRITQTKQIMKRYRKTGKWLKKSRILAY